MKNAPVFTVLLPAKGRPQLVRDALASVLGQSFGDFEVILSNNGAEAAIRSAVGDMLQDQRVRYVEQPVVLPMPQHWEQISLLARGKHLTVLPDRSVLKQGALATIANLHARGGPDADIVTWSWELYHSEPGHLQAFAGPTQSPTVLDSETVALSSLRVDALYPTALPRGLNSSVSQALITDIRSRLGAAFMPINPDFSFAYACLLSRPRITHVSVPLMISQGLNVSNGGNAYRTDASDYVDTLGLKDPLPYSPVKALLVENVIAEDFLAACHQLQRLDLLDKFYWVDFYLRCLAELDEKRGAGALPAARIQHLARAVDIALASATQDVQAGVKAARRRLNIRTHLRRTAKRLLGSRATQLRPLLARLRGGRRFQSALHAAGHHLG